MIKKPDKSFTDPLQQFIAYFEVWEEALPVIDKIVTPEEIELICAMKGRSQTLKALAYLWEKSASDLLPILEKAFCRNLLNKTNVDGEWKYSQNLFIDRLDHFVKYEEWHEIPMPIRRALDKRCLLEYTTKQKESLNTKAAGKDTINDAILLLHEVDEMLEQAEKIVVQPCNCRLFGQNCNKLIEVCISLNQEAESILSRGKGTLLCVEEAKDLVRKADKKGLMHTGDANWSKNGLKAICNCCACDCYPFRAAEILDSKGTWPESRYLAVIDSSVCDFCGICVNRCYFNAFVKEPDKINIKGKNRHMIRYDPEKCWGCGLCANTCKSGAITMQPIGSPL